MGQLPARTTVAWAASPPTLAKNARMGHPLWEWHTQGSLKLGHPPVKGKNGFVCIVGRGWTSAADPDFWNPKVRVPMCVNAAAARSYLVRIAKETEWGLEGRTPAQMTGAIKAAIAQKELPAMEPGAMCYMLSKQGYGGEVLPHWPPHLMFFFSDTDAAIWGANLPGSPVMGMSDPVEHLTQFVIQVQRWSDGSEGH